MAGTKFEAGTQVRIRCDVQPGPFSGEQLVTVETVDGAISGFVRDSELNRIGEQWLVRGIVKAHSEGRLDVWIRGSFLTTNGLAHVQPELAMAA